MKVMFDDFDTQIQSDELASIYHLDDEEDDDELNDNDADCYCE